jgi:hypothetical protein
MSDDKLERHIFVRSIFKLEQLLRFGNWKAVKIIDSDVR